MSLLIRLQGDKFAEIPDRFTWVAEDEAPPEGDIIISLARFQADGETLSGGLRQVGVWLEPHQSVEDLAYDLPRIPVIALRFAKFRDGRPYSSARLLRERLGYKGEVRAVGDVLREQAQFMVRCGFDAFAPVDGSSAEQWAAAAQRYRHVYQRAAAGAEPLFEMRAQSALHGAGRHHGL